ncbi:MAG: hypothetical protein JNK47_00885 [Mesorhizobium sp.]|nr:hypothetical protein [Mesorhizobium sp.]MBL8575754.1 hypothetical protein [Mesorhizobium sp.]
MSLEASRIGTLRVATFVAALAFVLQSALAFAAPPVQRDLFGNVICASGQMPAGDQGGGHLPNCCLLSCSMVSPLSAGLPDAISLPGSVAVVSEIVYPAYVVLDPHARRTPANPRAPPLST